MKKAVAVFVVLAVAIAGYVGAGPHLVLSAIQRAAQEQDSVALRENIDFPAVRESMKEQMNYMFMKFMQNDLDENPFSGLALMMVPTMTDNIVSAMVTPSGVANLFRGKVPGPGPAGEFAGDDGRKIDFDNAERSFESASVYSVSIPADGGMHTKLILGRRGITWKLIDVRLPVDEIFASTQEPEAGGE